MHTIAAIIDDQPTIAAAIAAAGLTEAARAAARPGQNAALLIHTDPRRARLFAWCGGNAEEEPTWLMLDAPPATLIALVAGWHASAGQPSKLN